MSNRQFGAIISRAAKQYELQPELIAAIIHQESKGNPFAIRFEQGFLNRYLKNKTRKTLPGFVPAEGHCSFHTEIFSRATSWGLMQLMGETAREHGLEATFLSELCEPETNIFMGAKILRNLINKHLGDVKRGLLAYNGGSNLSYPNEVLSHIERGRVAYLLF